MVCITAHILVTIVPSMYAVTNIGKPMCTAKGLIFVTIPHEISTDPVRFS